MRQVIVEEPSESVKGVENGQCRAWTTAVDKCVLLADWSARLASRSRVLRGVEGCLGGAGSRDEKDERCKHQNSKIVNGKFPESLPCGERKKATRSLRESREDMN